MEKNVQFEDFCEAMKDFLSSKLTEKFHTHLTEKLFYPQSASNFPQFPTIPEHPSQNLLLKYCNSPASYIQLPAHTSSSPVTTPFSNIYYFHG